MPLVEPPIANNTRMAFLKAAGVSILSMVSPVLAISTACAPVASATRMRSAVTAGGDAPPGTVMPKASAIHAMVLAVPITEHVPTLATNRLFTSSISVASISSARNCPQYRRQSVHAPTTSPRCDPVSIAPVIS